MRRSILLSATATLLPLTALAQSSSPKRGLCHVKENGNTADDKIWTSGPSNPTWYYNYGKDPSAAYSSDKSLQFVPMLWGASSSDSGTPFYDSVKRQIDSGANISYVLAFNEPDGTHTTGGSNLEVNLAAARWKAEIEPLKQLGVKLGAPAVTGAQSGWNWLDNWFKACDGGCNPDFIPVHWYGNFEGMMSHVGQVTNKWPNLTVWVTEYGYPNKGLEETQMFFNMSAQAFDRWPNVTHYSYFGAFRSSVSNVGANAAMLTQNGELTDIGSWYIGGAATNNIPKSSSASRKTSFVSRLFSEPDNWKVCSALFACAWLFLA
ncbi:hypothetical protein HBI56_035030 [Parastagonospora nodorum]|uniref:Asl1-like glycosyl hydrolase catalytic domain-containing protein n=1 Tax=Phaeosphaeria nodorum (strain SN15 / ATCC MYA-4574 / FGSC 10173) TaxID=321614 RepID=A0A7U2EYY1_PHANO|nr:hypothetical protein HBH56_022840 [Parastagonospora nodorum]QRC95620.1 hypothetical protein JI435_032870 [Parastagonospora nodorum SN15]KAH3936783.1 hypothetical protein HBH54_011620 [Parastagonospora nodorum]KAH3944069.1 hypothetical protein HBH53_165090 [Parastagonospora nodorum]KAH3967494.1 hypothetical protein HBH51_135070 [Parastagonospora nodorum]